MAMGLALFPWAHIPQILGLSKNKKLGHVMPTCYSGNMGVLTKTFISVWGLHVLAHFPSILFETNN